MNKIPYMISNDGQHESMTLFLSGVPKVITSTHQSYAEIKERINEITPQEVRELLDVKKAVQKQLRRYGNVTVTDSGVEYKGEVVHGLLADRMQQMLEEGIDIAPWALFMENLQQNPAKHAVDELYLWLERSNMPITERGNFLAYKKVNDDYCSFHRNANGSLFHNDIGTLCSMPRNKVDDNRNRTCSSGLHFCSWDYLPCYYGSSGKVLLVEVNPAHVVSIPSDYNNAKGRAEAYLVVGEIPQEECEHAFNTPFVSFDDSQWITWDNPDEIDYSSISDDWYDDYDLDDDEVWYEESYKEGFEEGRRDALAFKVSDCDEAYEASYNEWSVDFESFTDGYADGYWEASREAEVIEQEAYDAGQLSGSDDYSFGNDFDTSCDPFLDDPHLSDAFRQGYADGWDDAQEDYVEEYFNIHDAVDEVIEEWIKARRS